MPEEADYWRDVRKAKREAKRAHSVYCWQCGTIVWDTEKECRRCGTRNSEYAATKDQPDA